MNQDTFDRHCESFTSDGYTILPDLLTTKECAAARRELETRYPDRARGSFECLFNKARIFERFYQLPDLVRLIRHFIGLDALLSAIYGSVVQPGEGGRGLHSDGAITGHDREASMAPADEGRRVTSHPMVGLKPLQVTLLSPAQRPIQITSDLPRFWSTTYRDVRKDMRGKYPKHPWPEDPTNADPTLRTTPRKKV